MRNTTSAASGNIELKTNWFMADLHLDHNNVLAMCGRPFGNLKEQYDQIVTNINSVVKSGDTLYLLGDIILGKREVWSKFLNDVVCKNIILIKGNHDHSKSLPKELIVGIFEVARLMVHGRVLLLSHFPYRCSRWRAFWKRLHPAVCSNKRPNDRGLWLLHGHDHRKTQLVDYHPRMINVGVDANNFKPVSDKDIIRIIQKCKSASDGASSGYFTKLSKKYISKNIKVFLKTADR